MPDVPRMWVLACAHLITLSATNAEDTQASDLQPWLVEKVIVS